MNSKRDKLREDSARSLAPIAAQHNITPVATYRIQFNRHFTFRDAMALVPYLHDLGISHCYASSYLKARPGSSHGYDIIDHNALNPEIGTQEDFDNFLAALAQYGMRQILDIVPNHMGVMGNENRWWLDILENGASSTHADFFDIDWKPAKKELHNKVLLPILGDHYGTVLHRGEIVLEFDPQPAEFSFRYHKHRFPVDPGVYADILGFRLESFRPRITDNRRFENLIAEFEKLPAHSTTDIQLKKTRQRDKEMCKRRLQQIYSAIPALGGFIEENVKIINGDPDRTQSFQQLHALLEKQPYRLAFWKTAADEINYRRFFDVNELAGLRMQNDEVFDATHRFVLRLVCEGKIAGLRIDHIDGLYNPLHYLRTLVDKLDHNRDVYILVEKILAAHEHLHEEWPIHGTTGYEFANLVNGLFVDPRGKALLNLTYHRFIGHRPDFDEVLYAAKKRIIRIEMSGELNVLAVQLNRISEFNPFTRDFTLNSLRHALTEVTACFPVYRTYVTGTPISVTDRRYIDWAICQAKKRNVTLETSVFDFLQSVLTLNFIKLTVNESAASIQHFVMCFQQYTAPVMAKGMEDTALYRYNRLLSLNEVGGDPQKFGVSINAFHYLNQERLKHWPDSMLTTSTHDSKRSEDVRARLNVLSELPAEFRKHLARWRMLNRRHRRHIGRALAPARNDEYLLYQTLLGCWPLTDPGEEGMETYRERIRQYMLKAVKEAKVKTSWSYPDPEYEEKLVHFIDALLGNSTANPFLEDFLPFVKRIARYGLYNSLAQTLLKFTAPGMPDIYQGNELFGFSLTDPDNRNPVDYTLRRMVCNEITALDEMDEPSLLGTLHTYVTDMEDSRIKFYLTWKTLNLRHCYKNLFQRGSYQPLEVKGTYSDHICAYARTDETSAAITVVPRFISRLCPDERLPPLGQVWADTWVRVPEPLSGYIYNNVYTRGSLNVGSMEDGPGIYISSILQNFPAALLINQDQYR